MEVKETALKMSGIINLPAIATKLETNFLLRRNRRKPE